MALYSLSSTPWLSTWVKCIDSFYSWNFTLKALSTMFHMSIFRRNSTKHLHAELNKGGWSCRKLCWQNMILLSPFFVSKFRTRGRRWVSSESFSFSPVFCRCYLQLYSCSGQISLYNNPNRDSSLPVKLFISRWRQNWVNVGVCFVADRCIWRRLWNIL